MLVPFTTTDVHSGFSEAGGTLSLTDEFLEVRVTIAILGMIKQRPSLVKLARTAIRSIHYEKGYWGDKIVLRPYNPRMLDEIPGINDGEVVLKVKKKFRLDAMALVEEVMIWLTEEESDEEDV